MSVLSKIKKKHKLFYRLRNKELRSLVKTSEPIFMFIIKEFVSNGGEKKYQIINKDVKHWSSFSPLLVTVPEELEQTYISLFGKSNTVFSYDGSWKPLCELTLKTKKIK